MTLTRRHLLAALSSAAYAQTSFDIAINNGRVIDPASNLDAVRSLGISNGVVTALSPTPLKAKKVIDASNLVVSPGFIDMHCHGQTDENYKYKARDGVTTALELEIGVSPMKKWVDERRGKAVVNYGASVGHVPARMTATNDTSDWLPAGPAATRAATDPEQIRTLELLREGLREGGIGIGMGIAYTPFASRAEILDVFQVAAKGKVPIFVHMRGAGAKDPGVVDALQEMISDAAISGAPVHIVHLNSSSGKAFELGLSIVRGAKARGIDISYEAYPYIAGMTRLDSAIFNPGWREHLGSDYKDLMWVETGERLNEKTFAERRKQGGNVIAFTMREQDIDQAMAAPDVIVASDGWMTNGKGHPRAAGTYARVLAYYVREKKVLTLKQAISKMSYLPAERMEKFVPSMRLRGRIQKGSIADIAIFDPNRVQDKATYQNPAQYSEGITHVLVNGTLVVENEKLVDGAFPGEPILSKVTI
ncbi:MAG TPA: amidohydrolase family protein [Bryobacteraceae bacterium]|nr:amidohydrolase family protein [Bryobacteraceae bacterium]